MLVATVRACAWSLPASLAAPSSAVAAVSLSLPAGRLDQAISAIGRQFHVTIAIIGVDGSTSVPAIVGARSAAVALTSIERSGKFEVVAVSPLLFRIQAVARIAPPAKSRVRPMSEPPIVITGRKRRELAADVPGTVAIFRPVLADGAVPNSAALERNLPSLSGTAAGAGANHRFIRGIGDAPLGGFGQQSVAFLLGDARLTYDGPDPDLALVDIERVEILEGPQGPLYGTGALGGIIRIVPQAPDPGAIAGAATTSVAMIDRSGIGFNTNLVSNLPLNATSAIRIVVYGDQRPGWIDEEGGGRHLNRQRFYGGRAAWRWHPATDWTLDAIFVGQSRSLSNSRYVDGDIAEFERPFRQREPIDSDFRSATLSAMGKAGNVDINLSSSISTNEVDRHFASAIGDLMAPRIDDSRSYRTIDQELRFSGEGRINWLAGLSFLSSRTRATIGVRGDIPLLSLDRSASELAAYGEIGTNLTRNLDVAIGGRTFFSRVRDLESRGEVDISLTPSTVRLTPSATIRWRPVDGLTAYARYATAYRPGGVGIGQLIIGGDDEYRGDRLNGIEAGGHWRRGTMSIDVAAFISDWRSVQADFLLPTGLIATRNVGDARNSGAEVAVRFAVANFSITGRGIAQRARLESTETTPAAFDDRRLPIVPDVSARLEVAHPLRFRDWDGTVSVAINAQGATRLSFDPALDRRMPARATSEVNLSLSRGPWSASLSAINLTNADSDAYAFGNPFLVQTSRERTPLQPRSITITVGRRF